MNLRIVIIALSVLLAMSSVFGAEKTALNTHKDKLSYALGIDVGNSLKMNAIDVDADILAKGIKDALSGGQTLMTEQEVRATLADLQKDIQAKMQEKMKTLAEKNRKEGEAFLVENKKKEGVKTLPNGLQYKIITEGKGKSPKDTDTVTVNYRGTFLDGTEFDSSYKRGEPATLPMKGVIKGWTEALQLMKVGSKWELFIPSNLAYGETGRPGIPPNSVLIFEVELLKFATSDKK